MKSKLALYVEHEIQHRNKIVDSELEKEWISDKGASAHMALF